MIILNYIWTLCLTLLASWSRLHGSKSLRVHRGKKLAQAPLGQFLLPGLRQWPQAFRLLLVSRSRSGKYCWRINRWFTALEIVCNKVPTSR